MVCDEVEERCVRDDIPEEWLGNGYSDKKE